MIFDATRPCRTVCGDPAAFNTPVRATVTGSPAGPLTVTWSFAALAPETLVLSGVKRAENGQGMIIWWYNPLDSEIIADLTTALPFAAALRVRLDESAEAPLPGESDNPMHH